MIQMFRSTRIILPLVFSAAFACTLNAHADPSPGSQPDHPMKCGMEGQAASLQEDQGRRCGPIEALNLNDSQRASFRKAMEQMHQAMQGGRETRKALGDLVNSDSYDENKAHEIFRKNSATMENNVVAAATLMHNFYLSLSAEQKVKFNTMRLRMSDQMQRFSEKRKHHRFNQDEQDDKDSLPDEN